jgi:hypothetical protein
LPPDHPIARLRRLAEVLAIAAADPACGPELASDAEWFAAALRRYDHGAAAGIDLDRACGLAFSRGKSPWWETEAQHQRDALIRETHATYFAGLDISEAAEQIRQATSRLARQKRRPETGPGALLAEAARFMRIPQSTKKVREILEV